MPIKKQNSTLRLDLGQELKTKKGQTDESSQKSARKPKKEPRKTKPQAEPQTMDELLREVGDIPFGMKKGDMVEGVVMSVSPKAVFIDIGKKSFGIVAEWELSQVKDYAKMLKASDKVTAQIINPENDLGYIVLSLRKTSMERRWAVLSEKKEEGSDIEVIGLEVIKGGLLTEWQNLRGFIPATQLDRSVAGNPSVLISKHIKVKVLEVDRDMNRLVLSQKAASLGISPNILRQKLSKTKQGDILKGVISGIAQFGLFVDIDGLEGLVHISEIAWEKVEDLINLFKVGDKIEVIVIDVNQNEGKLNLSIKRLTPDPWKNILDRYPRDVTVTGNVVRKAPYGLFIQLEPGIEGLIHISKIPTETELKTGQEISCLVENVDESKRKISLTLVPTEKPVGYR